MDKHYVGDADQGKTQQQIEAEGKRFATFSARQQAVDWSQAPAWAVAYETRKGSIITAQVASWSNSSGELQAAPTFFMIGAFEHVVVPRPVEVPLRGDIAHAEALGGVEREFVPQTATEAKAQQDWPKGLPAYRRMDGAAEGVDVSIGTTVGAEPGAVEVVMHTTRDTPMSDEDVELINYIKAHERGTASMLRIVAEQGGDPRCMALAKTYSELAFMFAVKAVAKPADPYH